MDPRRNVNIQRQRSRDDRNRNLRLAFEAVLIGLCGYLIGVAGLPPLFDAPAGPDDQRLMATSTDEGGEVASPVAGADSSVNMTPGAGVSVTVARPTWTTGYFQAALFTELLGELGYQVSSPAANEHGPGDAFLLLAEGSVDFWASTWKPIHDAHLTQEMSDGSTAGDHVTSVGGLLPAGGLEGILVTKSVAEANSIASLDQINNDRELVDLFDADGNGKAEIYGCPDDFTCDNVIDEMLERNGWDNIEQIKDDYTAMVERSAERVDAGEAVLQYTWSPSGYLTMLRPGDNALWISLGGQEFLLDGSITPDFNFADSNPAELGAACTDSPCWLGWPPADIMVTANNDFLNANPPARVLFEQANLQVLDVALANVRYDTGETSEEDLARHAQDWINENRSTVDAWLAAARAAG